jgi:hypothetical protein
MQSTCFILSGIHGAACAVGVQQQQVVLLPLLCARCCCVLCACVVLITWMLMMGCTVGLAAMCE